MGLQENEEATEAEETVAATPADEGDEGDEGDEVERADRVQRSPAQVKVEAFINHRITVTVMMLATVYALIGLDMVALFQVPSKYDLIIDITSAAALILFFFEFGFKTYSEPKYTWSFFFWLDFIAAVSLVPDVPWIVDPIKDYFGLGVGGSALSLARVGRAARAGARAGRIKEKR